MKRVSIFVLILALALPLGAQRGQPQAPRAADSQTLSVNVDLVDLLVSVADKKGKFITSLKK